MAHRVAANRTPGATERGFITGRALGSWRQPEKIRRDQMQDQCMQAMPGKAISRGGGRTIPLCVGAVWFRAHLRQSSRSGNRGVLTMGIC